MRIAFTSCMSAQLFKEQPVWDEIAAADPDVLVLLGDVIYLDVGGPDDTTSLQKLDAYTFAQHAHQRYAEQLAQKGFKALVQRHKLQTHAIWDDHDFLWNDACGAEVIRNPAHRPLIHASRAMHAAFRATLAAKLAPGSFPAQPPAWVPEPPPPGYSAVDLGPGVVLHLTDGRSFKEKRGRKALLGQAQLDAMEARMDASPAGTAHLVASGVVFEARHGETWLDCDTEYRRMLGLAQRHNILILSGDIHDNNLASYKLDTGRNLFEATASGAAVRTAVVAGSLQRNYGLLEIDDTAIEINIFKSGAAQYRGTLNRANWQ